MVDWKSPAELQRESVIFTHFVHAILGVYVWEFCISLGFEWDLITRKKKFKWPLIFYFAGRYCLLFSLIGVVIALDTTVKINCETLYTFDSLTGNAALGLASINLSIRTMAVWSQNRWIIGLLVLVILGHWSLILQGVLIKAVWSPEANACIITDTNNVVLAATFIYSMAFDLLVLTLNAYKLISTGLAGRKQVGASAGSQIGRLIFADGLVYFFIAFLSNLLATVFMVLNLNQIMSVIFNIPAAVASTIVACRAVRRLTNFTSQAATISATANHQISQVQFRTTKRGYDGQGVGMASMKGSGMGGGVHVQMETFTRAEETMNDDVGAVGVGKKVLLTLDSGETVVLGGNDMDAEKGRVYGA